MRAALLGSLLLSLPLALACNGKGDDSGAVDDTGAGDGGVVDDGKTRVTILHTNDWQSHMLGHGPNAEYTPGSTGDDSTIGGLARIKTLADEIRAGAGHPVLMLDGGDWMAGALFQLLGTTHAAELQALGMMDYDAVTFGNHEFDWGPDALGQIISKADDNGVTVPILGTNVVPDPADPADDQLEAHFDSGRVQDTLIKTLDNGVTVGFFGLVGDAAGDLAPAAAPTTFETAAISAATAVDELQTQGVDLVIALTHNGVTDDPETSPDEVLANEVAGIDVIVGGHSHTPLYTERTANGTTIVQAGFHTRYLGELVLVQEDSGWEVESYTLHEIDDSIAGDPDLTALVDGFVDALEAGPLVELGYGFDEPIFSVPGDIPYGSCTETGIGNLVTDSYLAAMNAVSGVDPIDVAFETQGVIREGLLHGNSGVQAFSDVFRVMPLGFGQDGRPGYALVDFYVSASELADACEVTASASPFYGCNYFVEHSGMRCTIDMSNTPFTRVEQIELWQGDVWVPVDTSPSNPELYHVAVDSYTASLMYTLESLTSGLLVITPKDATGTPYADLADAVFDADPGTPAVDELKLWEAMVQYGASLPDTDSDGLPDLPDSYLEPAGRIVGFEL